MSVIPVGQRRLLSRLRDLFRAPLGSELTFGAEDERFYLESSGAIVGPADTQRFLAARVAAGGIPTYDSGGHALARVAEECVSWSLEAAGVAELSTSPYRLSELRRFGHDLAAWVALRDAEMARLGLVSCSFSAPPDLRSDAAAARIADSSRLRGLYQKFVAKDLDHPGLFTLFQEAVAQISFAPTSLREAAMLTRRAVQWAPLFYAATDNSSGLLGGTAVGFCPRSREWARHNRFTKVGRERAGVPPVLLDLAFARDCGGDEDERFVDRYLEHVAGIPLLFWYQDDALCFLDEPDFRALAARGEGTEDNAALALSFAWFDVRLCPISGPGDARWLRVELRSFDGGYESATWLAALLACGAIAEPAGGAAADQLFAETAVTPVGYVEARAMLPERGLDTPFGRTTLRQLLPRFCAIAAAGCARLGVPSREQAPLLELAEQAISRSECHRRTAHGQR